MTASPSTWRGTRTHRRTWRMAESSDLRAGQPPCLHASTAYDEVIDSRAPAAPSGPSAGQTVQVRQR
jgi:hypothetical protein